ncbi:MAG TPA: phosphoribosylamine--glycine ligase [Dehalococcoidia bacterium]|nr:phosphoribosylamine--glycine ligase [Dehalococcoidia bacterium]
MNVLLIGGGGREHAIAWKLSQSPRLSELFTAPGNAGTARFGVNLPLRVPGSAADDDQVEAFLDEAVARARECRADVVFVAPDDPLAWGLVDRLNDAGIAAFGATKEAAEIEASKGFAKALMGRYGIPSAAGRSFDSVERARRHLEEAEPPFVVKADGLAAGKGVTVAPTREKALAALFSIMADRTFGRSGERVVIEEFMPGRELSVHAFSDGQTFAMMPFTRDHKRVFDDDQGPNTGGMGVVAPVPEVDKRLAAMIEGDIVSATLEALATEGRVFKGVLYPGVMLTEQGPRVFECNARLGDPEAQALMPLLQTDLLDVIEAVIYGRLSQLTLEWSQKAVVAVVMASGGYPGSYTTGAPISGLETLDEGVLAFFAGVAQDGDALRTSGGRVLTVVATADSAAEARAIAYDNVARVTFEGAHFRTDIGAPN